MATLKWIYCFCYGSFFPKNITAPLWPSPHLLLCISGYICCAKMYWLMAALSLEGSTICRTRKILHHWLRTVRDLKLLKSFHSHQLCSFSTSHRRIILQMLFLSIINTLSVNLKGIPFISQFSYAYTIFFPHLACTDTLMLDQGSTCSWFQDVFTRWGNGINLS